jgi:2-polyprenyl-3-methyl-5-hydroxy-6-metoxy-1,4-benzoquinol methylase
VDATAGDASAERPSGREIRAAWDATADFWDDRMRAGATWQRSLIEPAVERLLELRPGERVLEIACGNGDFSRRMVELGGEVLATDFSERMLELARDYGGDIAYASVDATDEQALRALGDPASFDVAVCNMALMDMAEIEPLARALAALLRPDGRFVFSIMHPAFGGSAVRRIVEQWDDGGGVQRAHALRISRYISTRVGKGVAVEGQPVPQWYFDRSISELVGAFLRHGFVLDGIDEPVLAPDDVDPRSPSAVFVEVPPVLVARMRPWARRA